MAVITVKDKSAVLIPPSVMRKARIKVGDRLDASVDRGKITLTPKSVVERGIEQGLVDIKNGRSYGPYATVAAAKKSFDDRTRALKRRERAAS
jgi:bifunctional DNA-binding transcriptional regulator/antitoxin component of YhaV-PrlF toxin-antitoxin module